MPFTEKDRQELELARSVVADLSAKERAAVEVVMNTLWAAGLRVDGSDKDWADVARNHADAIRDALLPFDSGVRHKELPR